MRELLFANIEHIHIKVTTGENVKMELQQLWGVDHKKHSGDALILKLFLTPFYLHYPAAQMI